MPNHDEIHRGYAPAWVQSRHSRLPPLAIAAHPDREGCIKRAVEGSESDEGGSAGTTGRASAEQSPSIVLDERAARAYLRVDEATSFHLDDL